MPSAFHSAMSGKQPPKTTALAVRPPPGYALVNGVAYPIERSASGGKGKPGAAPNKPMVQRATLEKFKEEADAKIKALAKKAREGAGQFSFQKHGVWIVGGAAAGALIRNFVKAWLDKNPIAAIPESLRPYAPSLANGALAFVAWKSKKIEHKHFAAGLAAEIGIDLVIQFVVPKLSGAATPAPAAVPGAAGVAGVGNVGRNPLTADSPDVGGVGALDQHLAAMKRDLDRNAARRADEDEAVNGDDRPSVGDDEDVNGDEPSVGYAEDLDGDDDEGLGDDDDDR